MFSSFTGLGATETDKNLKPRKSLGPRRRTPEGGACSDCPPGSVYIAQQQQRVSGIDQYC